MTAKINTEAARRLLQAFQFGDLFREELGWGRGTGSATVHRLKEHTVTRTPIAALGGAGVYEITTPDGTIPDTASRKTIGRELQKLLREGVLIFVDADRQQSIWQWQKVQDGKAVPREHFYFRGQPGDLFIAKLAALVFDIAEFDEEGTVSIVEVADRLKAALDVETVTKKFYREYQHQYITFLELIEGIESEADRRWYASVLLNRLMFIYFLQKKLFLDGGRKDYLAEKLAQSKKEGKDKFYSHFLEALFFEGFAKPERERSGKAKALVGEIPYLNGGLFLPHRLEADPPYKGKIKIPDAAFEALLSTGEPKGLFERYTWSLNDTPGGQDNEINPDVLGYIFEKYINQKAFGAYYTRTEITEYLCEQTVYKLILDAVNGPEVDATLLKTAKLPAPAAPRYTTIAELLIHLDASTCRRLVMGEKAILPNLSLLDPACGSGAFLVAAMKTLINVYAAVLGRIDVLGDKKLTDWKAEISAAHPSIAYYTKKQIITANLYGVDLMEEATEIAKLRLFLALVASAETVEQLEPLPNIDFNILAGNSLIGLMRVDSTRFDKHYSGAPAKGARGKTLQKQNLFRPEVSMGNLFSETHAQSYDKLIQDKETNIASYKAAQGWDSAALGGLKKSIEESERQAGQTLNTLLEEEFTSLGIQYEEATWDATKGKEGKPLKRALTAADIAVLEPFHWGYHFSEIFRKKDGFDAIITNPPWEIFKPQAKEFFAQHSSLVTKNKMGIKDFEKEMGTLLKKPEVREAWLRFLSGYPHVGAYYRGANQYKNQISVVGGKRPGTDNNLYKLFTEQCYNLLRPGGYCGIVVPSGIYTDLGTKQLRLMLFDNTVVTGLFGFENRKNIFEGVDSRFKFVVLSFEKGGYTNHFPAAFMRLDVRELQDFLQHHSIEISVNALKRISPDSYSITEYRTREEVRIAEAISQIPMLSDSESGWGIELYGEEMHMTRSARFFETKPTPFPLYEGGMMHQFNHRFSEPRYWVSEKEIRDEFLSKRIRRIKGLSPIPKDLKNDYEEYRLAIRKIARNTDSRTLITTIIPRGVIAGNSLTVHFPYCHTPDDYNELRFSYRDLALLSALLNSYVADFILRGRMTTNLNSFYLYQLPVPRLTAVHPWYRPIVKAAARLICTTEDFAPLWKDVMGTAWSAPRAATAPADRALLRAELDGRVAHLYGLSEEEFVYILGTFPLVPQPQKVAAQNAFRDIAKGVIQPS